ncbi:MAG: SDR family oxidoreductase [bacterium]|nr:SDR family oxidoreductase [bacterium]
MKRRIVITGASSEIGLAIAGKIIVPGDEALLHYSRNLGYLKTWQKNKRYTVIQADFSREKELDNFCNQIGDADILVNAAACTICDILPALTNEQIEKMIKVNITALTKICRKVIPSMLAKRKGCILNISSVTARKGNRGQSVYAGTKGYIESFSRGVAAEFGSKGLRINCLAPGPVNSGSLKGLLNYAAEEIKQNIAAGHIGTPADIAAAAAFLCSDEASFINGAVLAVDGGFMKGV